MILPPGAKPIVDARKRGQKPAGMLIISLVGPAAESNHQIHANPAGQYDWRWIVGLKACIFFRSGVKWRDITLQIANGKPEWLGLYDCDRFKGADVCAMPIAEDVNTKPYEQWRYDRLAMFRWPQFENEIFAWGD